LIPTTYDGRRPPPRPKSFDTNDLRRFHRANSVPNKNQIKIEKIQEIRLTLPINIV
jgi:hypothetical protein